MSNVILEDDGAPLSMGLGVSEATFLGSKTVIQRRDPFADLNLPTSFDTTRYALPKFNITGEQQQRRPAEETEEIRQQKGQVGTSL